MTRRPALPSAPARAVSRAMRAVRSAARKGRPIGLWNVLRLFHRAAARENLPPSRRAAAVRRLESLFNAARA